MGKSPGLSPGPPIKAKATLLQVAFSEGSDADKHQMTARLDSNAYNNTSTPELSAD